MLLHRIMGRSAKPNDTENWNKNEFQGKRKDQIEYSYFAIVSIMGLTLLAAIGVGIYYLVNLWK